MNWRAILPLAGKLLEGAAAPYGALPLAFVTFAVDTAIFVIDAAESEVNTISIVQELEVRTAKLIESLKVGA